jgi:hypothetical protein
MAEVARSVRFIKVLFGLWVIVAPWLLWGATPFGAWAGRGVVRGARVFGPSGVGSQADEIAPNPYSGKSIATDEGRQTYPSKCISSRRRTGGRGPNLFKSGISGHGFVNTVLKGRSGTGMPVFRARLSEEDISKLRAFIESTDHYSDPRDRVPAMPHA